MVDDIDRQLVDLLARDGRRTYTSLAEELDIPAEKVRARVAQLEEDGQLTIVGICNALLLGLRVIRIYVKVRDFTPEDVGRSLADIEAIDHLSLTAGTYDIYIEATCQNHSQAMILLDKIRTQPGVKAMDPVFVTDLAKDYTWEGLGAGLGQNRA